MLVAVLIYCSCNVLTSAGRIVHKGSGAVVAETEFKLSEATKGLTNLDLRELELKDMEVARKLQEEEIKVSEEGREMLHFLMFFCAEEKLTVLCT